jgi:hypothetical protein
MSQQPAKRSMLTSIAFAGLEASARQCLRDPLGM